MKRLPGIALIIAFVASLGLVAWTPSAASASAIACQTFPETGKIVCGRFLEYWQQNGGLAQQGLPLTNEFIEVNPTDGKPYLTQYFERARFEYHPENVAPYDVLLGLLGREQLGAKYGGTPPPGVADNPLGVECVTFQQTGKQVCGAFLAYWQANGGLAQQGLPLSDLFLETNPTDGRVYPTQYFERARFEFHVENLNTPYVVLLGLLGREQYGAKYPSGLPSWGPTLAPLPGGKTFAHPSGHFSLNVPVAWNVLNTTATDATLGTLIPPVACLVTAGDAPAAGGIVALDARVNEDSKALLNYTVISKSQVVVAGYSAYRRVVTFTLADGTAVRGIQVYYVAGPVAGGVLCASGVNAFDGFAPTFDGVAGSLKLAGAP